MTQEEYEALIAAARLGSRAERQRKPKECPMLEGGGVSFVVRVKAILHHQAQYHERVAIPQLFERLRKKYGMSKTRWAAVTGLPKTATQIYAYCPLCHPGKVTAAVGYPFGGGLSNDDEP